MPQFLKQNEPVLVWTGKAVLDARLSVPRKCVGVVLMPNLSGTYYNDACRALAMNFQDNDFATLVADLLTPEEQQFDIRTGHYRADIPFLAERVAALVKWLREAELTRDLPIAAFASHIAASAVLLACANAPVEFFSIVLNAPRLDIVHTAIASVVAPTLLLADETDAARRAAMEEASALRSETNVVTVMGLTPYLDDAAALERVAKNATVWLRQHAPVGVVA